MNNNTTYIKAFKYNKNVVLRLQRSTKELYEVYYQDEDKDYREEIIRDFTGEWCNGNGGDCEFYGNKDIKKAIEEMKSNWEYENVKEITEQEFKEFKGDDFDYIKWEKENK